jgi:diguanylate cyclase (GGDEF)-like protein
MAGVAADVTEQKLAEERLLRMAHSDALTNLPNRRLFYDSLMRMLEHAREHHWIVGVLFVDLDRFKVVNDTLGHATGDELLRQVSERLMACVRIRDLVGRLGGDEFGVLLLLDDPNEAGAAAQKILQALVEPFTLEGREAFVSASIGITIYPDRRHRPRYVAALCRHGDVSRQGRRKEHLSLLHGGDERAGRGAARPRNRTCAARSRSTSFCSTTSRNSTSQPAPSAASKRYYGGGDPAA